MAISRWRSIGIVEGPQRATVKDIAELNEVFSAAFTDRYRRDGLSGVRVPYLNPVIWRYAIEDAADGALIWRDERGAVAAFNMVHQSGSEGWMGPLAVRADQQGHGVGKDVVSRGIAWLRNREAKVIGLETMPRTMDNIGFYSRLGFVPGQLTVTLSLEAHRHESSSVELLSRLSPAARDNALAECRALVSTVLPGSDYSREIALTAELQLGDTLLLRDGDALVGFALSHTAPLVEGRTRDELRVLKLVLADEGRFSEFAKAIANQARQTGVRRVSFRMQGEYSDAYRQAIAMGMHVRWTDLRMSLEGKATLRAKRSGLALSNWEI
jgi:GNAT superfamily N-acetyltransferase